MTNPQTEARAIAWQREAERDALIDEAKDFAERMTSQPWACELIERLATALAAKDAELVKVRAAHQTYVGKLTIAERALAERAGGVRFVGNIPGSSSASGFAPLTTEPVAPEGRQEAVVKPFGYYFWHSNGDGTNSPDFREGEIPSWKRGVYNVTPLYTRPAEQAVTEAMVSAALKAHASAYWSTANNGEGAAKRMRAALDAALKDQRK